ncbi:DUF4179 domain-containing protein [Desulfitibacter alkalitolerans]|uniref:DUF4179 domain-containing protein n=1 Tax=Desulfitibacter alkalitolerans TaxID=264641 RepID=UPI0004823991|nr:DUF4179 domain-containing protein [Desulfitibacter alkalitolerans]
MDKEIKEMKENYDAIKIPDALDMAIQEGILRGKRKMKKSRRNKGYFKVLISAAAVFLFFVIGINTLPTFADTIRELPGGEAIVRVLQFNKDKAEGGKITDGQDIKDIDTKKNEDFERLIVDLYQGEQAANVPGHFSITYLQYPYSILVEVSGVRAFSAWDNLPDLSGKELFDDIYRLITLDDSAHRFVVTFKKPVIIEVTEQNNPAKIIIDVREDEEAEKLPAVYSLRTASFPLGEGIAAAEGILKWELASANARLLRDTDGTYFVEEGYYLTEEEALARLSEVEEYEYFDFKMFIEKREPHRTPKSIAE